MMIRFIKKMRKISDKFNYNAIGYVTSYFIGQFYVLLC